MDASQEHIDEVGVVDAEAVSLSIGRIKTRKVKVATKVINQRKSKFVSRLKKYNRARTSNNDQDFIPSVPWHAIFVFLDPILIGVLQIEYQNKKESIFDTHPIQMQSFLMAICIYCTLLGIKIHTQAHSGYKAQILSYTMLLLGAHSSASLLSILLQRELLWVVLLIWGSLPILLACHLLKSSVCLIKEMVAKLTFNVRNSKFAKVVLKFYNTDSACRCNDTYPANPVEGIL